MKILITGSNGFIGKNLCAHLEARGYLDLLKYDQHSEGYLLDQYAAECDFVFHLAGINRPVKEADFEENHSFTAELIEALNKSNKAVPVVMSSSIQAILENPYGLSKKKAEELVFDYGRTTGADIYVFRLPGVFGKWSSPNYNSVVATFCHNIAREIPITINDPEAEVSLVYIDDVLNAFTAAIKGDVSRNGEYCEVTPIYHTTVGQLADMIQAFHNGRKKLMLASVGDPLIHKLYSTYLTYLPEEEFSYGLLAHSDDRGVFAECLKSTTAGQVSVNITRPGQTKGGHWHHTKTEKIIVVSGSAMIRFQKLGDDKVLLYPVSADNLEVVDIPPGYAHDLTNTGDSDMVMLVWANQIFDPLNPDTYPYKIGGRE